PATNSRRFMGPSRPSCRPLHQTRPAREITKTSRGRPRPLAQAGLLLQKIAMKRPALKNFRRIVVKVGSSLLIDSAKGELRSAWLKALAADIAKLHGEGRDVLVVSSGSIALGRSRLKLPRGQLKLEESQGAAAVGQIALARIWSE